jgi:hypothetical protein
MTDMDEGERAPMMAHVAYWSELLRAGHAVVFGPIADPAGAHGIGIVAVRDEGELASILSKDPAILAGRGLRHDVAPMAQAVVRA